MARHPDHLQGWKKTPYKKAHSCPADGLVKAPVQLKFVPVARWTFDDGDGDDDDDDEDYDYYYCYYYYLLLYFWLKT